MQSVQKDCTDAYIYATLYFSTGYGWYHLYGHVHSSFEWNMMERVKYEMKALYDKECHMYNVGCMISLVIIFLVFGSLIIINKIDAEGETLL